MYVKFLLFNLLFLLLAYPILRTSIISNETSTNINLFNNLLNRIGENIETNNFSQVCNNSQKASILIRNNLISLQAEEEYYHWKEIHELLELMASDFCENSISSIKNY